MSQVDVLTNDILANPDANRQTHQQET